MSNNTAIAKSPAAPHCELCARTIEEGTDQGYTLCCNELVCGGGFCVVVLNERDGWTEKIHFNDLEDAEYFVFGDN